MKTAQELDKEVKGLAENFLHTEGEILLKLMEMRKRRHFLELDYTGIFDYCVRRLKLSRSQAYYFKLVAEKADEVPRIQSAVVQGELTLSQARRIAPVLTLQNQEEWIEKARSLKQPELEREVAAINPKAHVKERIKPVAKSLAQLVVGVTPETEEDLKALTDILSQKLKRPVSLGEVIAWAANHCRERLDPERKAKRRKISSGKLPEPKTGRRPVRASTMHEVVARQGWQCSHVGVDGRRCEQKRWLHKHHIKEVSKGGLNTVDNLILLCSAHHRLEHSHTFPKNSDPGAGTWVDARTLLPEAPPSGLRLR